MAEKMCKDCGCFKEDIIGGGVCWCSLDGAAIGKDDSCKIVDRAKATKELILDIKRLLEEVKIEQIRILKEVGKCRGTK